VLKTGTGGSAAKTSGTIATATTPTNAGSISASDPARQGLMLLANRRSQHG
jgi:hypothetical protein